MDDWVDPRRSVKDRSSLFRDQYNALGKSNLPMHKFAVGQSVHLTLRSYRSAAAGPYKICRLVPMSETGLTNPGYLIKSEAEKHERVAAEDDLTLSNNVQPFSPGQGL